MDVDRHAEAAALRGKVAEQVILEDLVIGVGRSGMVGVLPVDTIRLDGVRRVEGERAQVRRLKFLSDRAALFVISLSSASLS